MTAGLTAAMGGAERVAVQGVVTVSHDSALAKGW